MADCPHRWAACSGPSGVSCSAVGPTCQGALGEHVGLELEKLESRSKLSVDKPCHLEQALLPFLSVWFPVCRTGGTLTCELSGSAVMSGKHSVCQPALGRCSGKVVCAPFPQVDTAGMSQVYEEVCHGLCVEWPAALGGQRGVEPPLSGSLQGHCWEGETSRAWPREQDQDPWRLPGVRVPSHCLRR